MTAVLLVQGTHGWGRSADVQWWECRSPFVAFLRSMDFRIIGGDRPYIWDTDLDGIGWLHRRPFKKHRNWEAAGLSLYAYIVPPLNAQWDDYVPIADRNLIAHSHAMQVVAYACAAGLKINRLITIGSPVRQDMDEVYHLARANIREWMHVHSDGSDRVQWFGELFDGHLGIVRKQAAATTNLLVAKVSHSKLLNDPSCFLLWQTKGLVGFLTWPISSASHAGRPRICDLI